MLSETGLRTISELIIGDTPGYYSYKPGSKIVDFFNANFGFSDVYESGFPSRWSYTLGNIKIMLDDSRFDELLNIVFSKRYVMADNGINEVEALTRIEDIVKYLNNQLNIEGYRIYKVGQIYKLTYSDSDLEFIGEGGFAKVYKSHSTGLIVKKLKDDFKTLESIRHRFEREFNLTRELSDLQGVIEVFEFDYSDYSYTMEEAESTLEYEIKNQCHSEESKLTIIVEILNIMKNVHDRNIIHRDISPNNVLLLNKKLKISDFGLGKDLDIFHSHRTMMSHSMGQYHYCAPEQFMQLKEGDKRSDVYSMGSLINFIMTGDPRNNKHFLRNPVEKAKNENPNVRYEDAALLLKGIEKSIGYHRNQERKELINTKIRKAIYDEDVENYIYTLDASQLCKIIVEEHNMGSVIYSFIKSDEKRTIEILDMIENEYLDVCKRWTDYDKFGNIAYDVIRNNLAYVAQEVAARILNNVAYDKNRFDIKDLVDDLIKKGVDPLIEEILK